FDHTFHFGGFDSLSANENSERINRSQKSKLERGNSSVTSISADISATTLLAEFIELAKSFTAEIILSSMICDCCIFYLPLNAKHSGDLGMATKEPWKGRPAAIGRELLRLVVWCEIRLYLVGTV